MIKTTFGRLSAANGARMTNQENENAEKQTHDGDQHRLKDLLGTVTEQNKNMETHVPRQETGLNEQKQTINKPVMASKPEARQT